MLWVVLKLHYIEMPVSGQHQLALRPATHPLDMLHRLNCQARSPTFSDSEQILSALLPMICTMLVLASIEPPQNASEADRFD
jgi:hypothetical protein